MTEPQHPAELVGTEVDKDVGIADQHRARLKARIAGNVAPGFLARVNVSKAAAINNALDCALEFAEVLLVRCGL